MHTFRLAMVAFALVLLIAPRASAQELPDHPLVKQAEDMYAKRMERAAEQYEKAAAQAREEYARNLKRAAAALERDTDAADQLKRVEAAIQSAESSESQSADISASVWTRLLKRDTGDLTHTWEFRRGGRFKSVTRMTSSRPSRHDGDWESIGPRAIVVQTQGTRFLLVVSEGRSKATAYALDDEALEFTRSE